MGFNSGLKGLTKNLILFVAACSSTTYNDHNIAPGPAIYKNTILTFIITDNLKSITYERL